MRKILKEMQSHRIVEISLNVSVKVSLLSCSSLQHLQLPLKTNKTVGKLY